METKVCFRCRKEKPKSTSEFDLRSRNTDGYKGICRECESVGRKLRYAKNPEKYRTRNRDLGFLPKCRFSRFKKRCVFTGKHFDLSFEQWCDLVLDKPCHYCDGPLEKKGCGLDRKDNTLGYVIGNVVSCCKECNRLKGPTMAYAEMLAVSGLLKQMRSK